MKTRIAVALSVFLLPALMLAQHGGGAPPLDTKPPREAQQYAFLVGQWELDVKPKATTLATRIHGMPKLQGTWKAWRALDGWGIEDELRIVDAAGNPLALTHFVRVYDAAARRWNVSALEVYRGRFTVNNASLQDGEMRSSSSGTDAEGKPYLSRVRISAITPTSFRYQQDRSMDGGKKWMEGFLVIEARRTAAIAPR